MRDIGVVDVSCCPPLLEGGLEEDEAASLASGLRVLGDPGRLRLLSLIAGAPDGEACQCDLADALGLAQPTVSHHLRVLERSGLIEREQRGRWAFYRARSEPLEALSRALSAPARSR